MSETNAAPRRPFKKYGREWYRRHTQAVFIVHRDNESGRVAYNPERLPKTLSAAGWRLFLDGRFAVMRPTGESVWGVPVWRESPEEMTEAEKLESRICGLDRKRAKLVRELRVLRP